MHLSDVIVVLLSIWQHRLHMLVLKVKLRLMGQVLGAVPANISGLVLPLDITAHLERFRIQALIKLR